MNLWLLKLLSPPLLQLNLSIYISIYVFGGFQVVCKLIGWLRFFFFLMATEQHYDEMADIYWKYSKNMSYFL